MLARGTESLAGGLVDLLAGGDDFAVLNLFHDGAHLAGGHSCRRQIPRGGQGPRHSLRPHPPRGATRCARLHWPLNVTSTHVSLLPLPLAPFHLVPLPVPTPISPASQRVV